MEKAVNVNVLAKVTAEICGVSDNYVRKVLRCDRDSELIVLAYTDYAEMIEDAKKTVKQRVESYKQTGVYA